MEATKSTRPLYEALNKVGVGVVRPFAKTSRDIVIDTLRQAHALTVLMSAAVQDVGELQGRQSESALGATTEAIKADALEALGSLIALASALTQEAADMARVTKAALAAANVVVLPTAAPRQVDNYRYADQRRASSAARKGSRFAERYKHHQEREADLLATDLTAIEQSPALLIVSAMIRTMDADAVTRVLEQIAPGAVGGSKMHKDAVTTIKASRLNFGEQFDLMRALDRMRGSADMATLPLEQRTDDFDPAAWLTALSSIGGGYALMSGRRLAFLVQDCDGEDLTIVMSHIVGHTDRQEAIKNAIEQRSLGQVA